MKFVIMARGNYQPAMVANSIAQAGAAFWQWQPGVWIVNDPEPPPQAPRGVMWWQGMLHQAVPQAVIIVVRAHGDWAGWGAAQAFQWMHNDWD